MSFSLAIAGQTPTGCRLNCEADFYYPLQMKLEQWHPKTTKGPTEQPPTTTTISTPTMQYVQERIDQRLGINGKRRIVNRVDQVIVYHCSKMVGDVKQIF